ncbi:MAG TPA: GDSL-type esterase/lipase family protein [Chitinophagaceae bacterium]
MKYIVIILLVSAVLGFAPNQKRKVIFFGDSITQAGVQPGGYIRRIDSLCKLEKKQDGYEFVGSGVSANKVYDLYLRLEEDVLSKNPDIVVIYIGVNDVWHKTSAGTGTDANKFEQFYRALIKKMKDKGIRLILATPAVIGERHDFSNQQDGDLNQYSNIIRTIASTNNIPLVDLRLRFLEYSKANNPQNNEKGILTSDRVHLNEKGNQLVAEEFWKAIKAL